jgi:hypothetical protein
MTLPILNEITMPSATWNRSKIGIRTRWTTQNTPQGGPQVQVGGYTVTTPVVESEIGSRISNKTPNYRGRRRAKEFTNSWSLPMNGFHYETVKLNRCNDGYDAWKTHLDANIWSRVDYDQGALPTRFDQDNWPGLSGSEIASLEAQAVAKVLGEIRDSKVNVGQVLGERGQTVNLFANTAKRVYDVLTNLKKGNWNRAAEAVNGKTSARKQRKYRKRFAEDPTGAVANGWLELQYGWLPLLEDCYGAAELIAQKRVREVRTKTVKKKQRWLWSEPSQSFAKGITLGNFYGAKTTTRLEYTIKYVVYYSTPNEGLHTLAQLGVTNPALIAWELTPWSFVIDWFIPIGNFLASMDATYGLTFEKGCKTVFQKWTSKTELWGGDYKGGSDGNYRHLRQNQSREKVICDRTPLTGFPRPALPRFKNPVSTLHIANAVSLLTQLLKR